MQRNDYADEYTVGTVLEVLCTNASKFVIVYDHTKAGTPKVIPLEIVDNKPIIPMDLDKVAKTYTSTLHWSSKNDCYNVYGFSTRFYNQ